MEKINPYLLPRTVEPIHYDITFRPDVAKFTFSGSETIQIAIKEATAKVVLHSLDLKVKNAELRLSGRALKPQRIAKSKKFETLTLEFGETLQPGDAALYLEFKGELNDKMHGFYRTSYMMNGAKTWGAATQFEATDARRAFPCWDEPERKATFTITLTVPEHLTALSNMPVTHESKEKKGWKTIVYDKSPVMSTYLVAVVIADLEHTESTDRNGIPIRVWTNPGKKEQGRFALEAACHTLPYFAEWFGVPYALPKLDMVALPDFAAGAMENWGLVTYRETALLVDPQNSAASARQRVSEVVDHELAHQWFGNYTTMKWWTDLWLNEGFASYMGPKATDHHFPEWDLWTQYVSMEYMSALHEDSLRSTHAVEVPVKNPYEIREVFDAISYSKGSVINRMLDHYLGEENLRKGLKHYLTGHAFANATTADLWKAIEEASGKPVQAMMTSYTRQPGYPVLLVKRTDKKKGVTLSLEQRRFLIDGGEERKKTLWQVPVGVLTSDAQQPSFEYMEGKKYKLAIPSVNGGWIKLNPGQSGFYRVAYPDEMWLSLAKAVEAGALPVVDRLGLLDDAFALARAGYLKSSTALSVLMAYRHEKDFSVWRTISGVFGALDNLLSGSSEQKEFRKAAQEFFRPIAAHMTWDKRSGDGHLDALLRSIAWRNLGGYGDQAAITEARNRFERFRKDGSLDPDIRQAVYSLVSENGGEKEWQEMLAIYNGTELHEERLRALNAGGQSHDIPALKNLLTFSLSEAVRSQDTPIVLGSMGSHPQGRQLAWEFLKEKWPTFVERYNGGGIKLLSRAMAVANGFTTKQELEDAESFFGANPVPGTERSAKKILEYVRSTISWLERDGEEIRKYFAGSPRP